MSPAPLFELGITVGTKCNFRCAHCIAGRESRSVGLSAGEVALLVRTIREYSPPDVVFTGGEPTLYPSVIRKLASLTSRRGGPRFRMITNGHFATTLASARRTLRALSPLSSVQLSYDRFHAEFLPADNVANLNAACEELHIRFSVVASIESPLDMLFWEQRKLLPGVDIHFQKVIPMGRAAKNKLAYRYPDFDPSVLDKKCPDLGKIVYNCGSGFTVCCSFLADRSGIGKYVHPTLQEHLDSPFYELISRRTFGEMLPIAGFNRKKLSASESSPCALCLKLVPRILKR